jgi:hypothetical protein
MTNGAVSAAAAAARMQQLREEEEMTPYSPEDLNNWEFKIVRANTGIFSKPAEFNKLIQEEARAGWELLEKFDNQRVRFKRPISARARDGLLPASVNPYRTQYGMSRLLFALLILFVVMLAAFLMFAVATGLSGLSIGTSPFTP